MSKPAFDALLDREEEVETELEKTVIIAAKAIIEALYKTRY